MCLASLYDLTHDQREAIAKVQTMRALRDVKHQWRDHYRSMPTIAVSNPAISLPRDAAVVGAYFSQGEAA